MDYRLFNFLPSQASEGSWLCLFMLSGCYGGYTVQMSSIWTPHSGSNLAYVFSVCPSSSIRCKNSIDECQDYYFRISIYTILFYSSRNVDISSMRHFILPSVYTMGSGELPQFNEDFDIVHLPLWSNFYCHGGHILFISRIYKQKDTTDCRYTKLETKGI